MKLFVTLGLVTSNRQSILGLHDLCLEVLTVDGNELHLFNGQGIPFTLTFSVPC